MNFVKEVQMGWLFPVDSCIPDDESEEDEDA